MKRLLPILAAMALAIGAHAQTNTPTGTFFDSVTGYFTSFNTNLSNTFLTDNLDIFAGTDNLDNERMTATLGIVWNISNPFSLEGSFRNATVAGTVVTAQGGFGYSVIHMDAKLTGYLHAGYRFDTHEPFIAPGLRVMKALTENTFAGASLELDLNVNHIQSNLTPTFGLFAGFKL